MKTIVFARSPADCDVRGAHINCADALARSGASHLREFSAWLGEQNRRNAGLLWWARPSTSKNLLSSPLGERFMQVQALCRIVQESEARIFNVVGMTPGQMETARRLLPEGLFKFCGNAWRRRFLTRGIESLKAFLRPFLHIACVVVGFWRYRAPAYDRVAPLCFFTYLDAARPAGSDRYFGALPRIFSEQHGLSSLYVSYVDRPYRRRLRELQRTTEPIPYIALFGTLRVTDNLWALGCVFRQWWRNLRFRAPAAGRTHDPLLQEIFMVDLAVGGFLLHLLLYRAMRRFLTVHSPRVLIYPFENKAIEKMILLAAAAVEKPPRTVGYQHTSITPRHASTLFFTPEEAQGTPLPDKIVTCGKLTREVLESRGNYPQHIFTTGCALRQVHGPRLPRPQARCVRVLLALSSSRQELTRATAFFRDIKQRMPQMELGIRPHPTFPLSMLPPDLAQWVAEHVQDFSAMPLADNLQWCSVTAYVSSTVALEALMLGRPIINIPIGEFISSDPIIGEAPFHWAASDEAQFITAIRVIHEMADARYEREGAAAVAYANNYLAPIDEGALAEFRFAIEGDRTQAAG